MLVYVDSSALVKRAISEPETDALVRYLGEAVVKGATIVSSSLAWIEVTRAIRFRPESEAPARVVDPVELALSLIAYDQRLLLAAEEMGLRTLSPS